MQVKSEAFIAQVIADGRVTIPETVRKFLGLNEGDLVKVTVEKTEVSA